MDSTRGQLLIAGPSLAGPQLLADGRAGRRARDDGALGLVLNRPSETTVGEAVPQLEQLVDLDDPLFVGGPVQPSAVIVLAEFEDPGDAALIAFDDVGVLATGGARRAAVGVRRAARSPATRAGAPASSTPSSSAVTGSSSRPSTRRRVRRAARSSCGRRC